MSQAEFVEFRSRQDLNAVPAGDRFYATWRVRNTGPDTWGPGYQIVHIHEDQGSSQLAARDRFPLTEVASRPAIEPDSVVDITLEMTAPDRPDRRFFTDWQLQNPQGQLFGDVIWLRLVTAKPAPSASAGYRSSESKYVADHSVPDGTPYVAGTSFRKQWLVRNNGQRKWGEAYRLVFVGGDLEMAGTASHPVPIADPGDEVVLSVDMVAPPPRANAYLSSWRIHDDRNIPFGDTFWVKIFATPPRTGRSIMAFSQNDPAWKDRILGQGPKTLGQFGCMLSCFAMMLTGYGEDTDPWRLNQRCLQLTQNGFNGSNLFFVAPAYAYDHIKYLGNFKPLPETGATYAEHDPNLIQRIDSTLTQGQAVVIQVDFSPATAYNPNAEQHWVLVVARRGDDYLVIDPLDGPRVSLLSRYGVQNRPQNPDDALRAAIKSALFFRSTTEKIDFMASFADVNTDAGSDGLTDIGAVDELVYTGPAWHYRRCLRGVHDRSDRHPQPADHALAKGKFETVKVQSGVQVHEMRGYAASADFYLCRLFESWNGRDLPVEEFVRAVIPDIRPLVDAGVEYFEFHNEPNLSHEGLRTDTVVGSWRNGAEFATYFLRGRELLQQTFPHIKVGFPGLSPGPSTPYAFGHDRGFRLNDQEFLAGAGAALQAADFICVHAYFANLEEVRGPAIETVRDFRRRWPDKLLFVTEFSNPTQGRSPEDRGAEIKEFYRLCNEVPGVGAAYYFIISGTNWDHQALRFDNDRLRPNSTGVLERIL